MTHSPPWWRRVLRGLAIVIIALVLLVLSGLLLADHLTPKALGEPSTVLPAEGAATRIDRELGTLLAQHPGHNGVAFLSDGLDAFAARTVLSERAGRSLDLQYYIWHDDLIGYLMARTLHDAAERGVRVRILLDDMNAQDKDALMLALHAHPNIEIRLYNPFRNRNGIWRMVEMVQRVFSVNHRMHNKSWIADGRAAIVGGRNIGEEYFSARPDVNFRDLDLLVAGPAVDEANRIFDDYWNSDAAVPISALAFHTQAQLQLLMRQADNRVRIEAARPYLREVDKARKRAEASSAPLHWSPNVHVVSDPPMKHRHDDPSDWLVTTLVRMFGEARHKALLMSPYFVPGEEGLQGLQAMRARGMQVGVVTNSLAANDVVAVHGGYMHYRVPLLQAGVQLYELKAHGQAERSGLFGSRGASLHTKAFVLDDRHGFVGSFNLDPRSAYLNTEMGIVFDDPVLARQLTEEYLHLTAPQQSWWLALDGQQQVRWLQRDGPPQWLLQEPDSSLRQRASARVIGWLPLESQL